MPETPSAQLNETITSPLFQPYEFAAVRCGVMTGFDLSILTVTTLLALLTLPAASVTVFAVEATASPSSLRTWSAGQLPSGTPESASAQVKWTVTLSLYHLLSFAAVFAAAVMVGIVLSMFTATMLL